MYDPHCEKAKLVGGLMLPVTLITARSLGTQRIRSKFRPKFYTGNSLNRSK